MDSAAEIGLPAGSESDPLAALRKVAQAFHGELAELGEIAALEAPGRKGRRDAIREHGREFVAWHVQRLHGAAELLRQVWETPAVRSALEQVARESAAAGPVTGQGAGERCVQLAGEVMQRAAALTSADSFDEHWRTTTSPWLREKLTAIDLPELAADVVQETLVAQPVVPTEDVPADAAASPSPENTTRGGYLGLALDIGTRTASRGDQQLDFGNSFLLWELLQNLHGRRGEPWPRREVPAAWDAAGCSEDPGEGTIEGTFERLSKRVRLLGLRVRSKPERGWVLELLPPDEALPPEEPARKTWPGAPPSKPHRKR